MNLVKNYLTKNRCYKNAKKIKVEKLVLHSLGAAQPNADVLIKSWNNALKSVCVHGFIETDRVIQTLPWDYKAWHVGSGKKGSYNNNAIGIEICEPRGHTYKGGTMIGYNVKANEDYFNKVYKNAVELFAYLCKEFNLNPLKDIYCHSEVYKLGYGSNHADVLHWFPKHGKSMDGFRSDVKSELNKVVKVSEPVKDKPKENKPTNTNTENIYHIVKKGETLYGLAIKYKTSISKLKELNGLKSTVLQIGQKLIVSGYSLYIVIKGDTLSKISRKTLDNANRYKEIMELNNLKSTVINIGQKLKIPNK